MARAGEPPAVVLASCAGLPEGDGDDDELLSALRAAGVQARWQAWDTSPQADLVIVRATWDYTERPAEFLAWARQVPVLANPAAVLTGNADKRYLLDLAADGVPVVPTLVVARGEHNDLDMDNALDMDSALGNGEPMGGELVVKPAVGAGSRGAARFTDHGAAQRHVDRLHAEGSDALVQPYLADVEVRGETAMVFLDGSRSHAFHKGAMLGAAPPDRPGHPGRAGAPLDPAALFHPENLRPHEAPEAAWRLGERALASAASRAGVVPEDLLYARVDVLGEEPVVLEVELIEPSLGWRQIAGSRRAEALGRFVRGVSARLDAGPANRAVGAAS